LSNRKKSILGHLSIKTSIKLLSQYIRATRLYSFKLTTFATLSATLA